MVHQHPPTLNLACLNLEYGGIDPGQDDFRWGQSIATLSHLSPDVVLLQEMNSRIPATLHRHLWATANALDMVALLGPPSPLSLSGNHPAILVRKDWRIEDAGPPAYPPGFAPAWCYAEISLPGFPHTIDLYSVHLPPSSAPDQVAQAARLATIIARNGRLALVAGDFNCYAAGPDAPSSADLECLPPHLGPSRMVLDQAGNRAPNLAVDETFRLAGLHDAAPLVSSEAREPNELAPTGAQKVGRIDRFYVTQEFLATGALTAYAQRRAASDHAALLLTVNLAALTAAKRRGPLP